MSAHQDSIEPEEVNVAGSHHVDAPAEGGERRRTHHDLPEHGHNLSMQRSVDENPDLALHYSHEHQHKHLHHGQPALVGKHDEVLYADGTTTDQHYVKQNPQDYTKHQLRPPIEQVNEMDFINNGDAEKGEVDATQLTTTSSEDDGKKHRVSRTYARYKVFAHIFIWVLFTA